MSSECAVGFFPPPVSAASLYDGQVMHARMKPKSHRFTYTVYSLLIDITALDKAASASWLFGVNRFGLLSFHENDHGNASGVGNGVSLADHATGLLKTAGLAAPPARILLMCYPRVLGFTFNPIAVYFAYQQDDRLIGVIYEVRNTFGEMHTYVAPVQADELTESGLRQERSKLFYVSPFMDLAMTYRFRIRPPAKDLALRILENDAEGPILAASFIGKHTDLTSMSVLSAFFRIPLMTLKVVGGIHWEALKLWSKGVRFLSRPPAPPTVSIDGVFLNPAQQQEGHQ
ncbi:MAG: DUF1365 domain-containing protein [Beijerinckiaceae bacterium]